MESLVFAKGAAGQYFTDLVEACEDHFNRIYPECVNSTHHETVMCPPVFPFGYVAPTGQASGAKALTRVEEDTIRGDNAELKNISAVGEVRAKHETAYVRSDSAKTIRIFQKCTSAGVAGRSSCFE